MAAMRSAHRSWPVGLAGLLNKMALVSGPMAAPISAGRYWKRFEQLVGKIRDYLPVVEAAGVRDLCYIYCFDERPPEQLDVVYETARRLKQLWPDIEVMTTARDTTFGLKRPGGGVVDIWVPLTATFGRHQADIRAAQEAGRDVWWYICLAPRHPYANWFIEYPAIEARLVMGAMVAKFRPGGFLYYNVGRWPGNRGPILSGPRTEWKPASYRDYNGDGSLICPGPDGPLATVRLENVRDGIEDFEYYRLLRDLLTRAGRPNDPAGKVGQRVVSSLTAYSRDPSVLLTERRRVARAILALKKRPAGSR